MQDGVETGQGPVEEPLPPPAPPLAMPPPRRRGGRGFLLVVLLAFVVGGALAGWLVWRGDLDAVLPASDAGPAVATADSAASPRIAQAPATLKANPAEAGLGGVETRLALLEDRFSRIDQEANAASANASRAEALLVALATRRTIEQGEPLGYLENQLRLRFGGSQPQAVQTIVAAGKTPVTLYSLSSELEAETPALSGERRTEGTWTRVQREVASLFVVRRASSSTARPLDRAERAQILLKAGRIDDAIAEVERLPGADDAQDWIASAQRYAAAQRALAVIETAAMLESRGLRDGQGVAVSQPSPLTPPAESVN